MYSPPSQECLPRPLAIVRGETLSRSSLPGASAPENTVIRQTSKSETEEPLLALAKSGYFLNPNFSQNEVVRFGSAAIDSFNRSAISGGGGFCATSARIASSAVANSTLTFVS